MRRLFIVLGLIVTLVLPLPSALAQRQGKNKAGAASAASAGRSAAETITATQLRDYLNFVASDEMEGRDTPSRGLNTTAKFIATLLARWGIKPAGDDGTYFQKIALRRSKVIPDQTRVEMNGQTYTYGDDFLATPSTGSVTGNMVFVGNGWVIKAKNMDAYKGVDVRGKILVVTGDGIPNGIRFSELAGKRGEDWADPVTFAAKNGALGVIEIPDFDVLANWERVRRNQLAGGSLSIEKLSSTNEAKVPLVTFSARLAMLLFQGEKVSASDLIARSTSDKPAEGFDLNPNKKVSFTVVAKAEEVWTQNVVASIEGSDPTLKNEYVAVGAHYDHVGVGPPGGSGRGPASITNPNDQIYNGADDDGSGTVSILAIAEALAHAPRRPKRSVLFVWHCGEEKGLWGSEYFAQYPTVPIDHIVTQLNIDMIGRSKKAGDTNPLNASLTGPNEIYVIGSKMMSTELGELSERVNQSYLNLNFNYKYDDPADPNRFFFRSDHYNYAQRGVPIIFYFDGTHEDYHRPGDEPQKIDYDKMQAVARTVFVTMWEVADGKTKPMVDKQLPAALSVRRNRGER